jgi:hypothetical protein
MVGALPCVVTAEGPILDLPNAAHQRGASTISLSRPPDDTHMVWKERRDIDHYGKPVKHDPDPTPGRSGGFAGDGSGATPRDLQAVRERPRQDSNLRPAD